MKWPVDLSKTPRRSSTAQLDTYVKFKPAWLMPRLSCEANPWKTYAQPRPPECMEPKMCAIIPAFDSCDVAYCEPKIILGDFWGLDPHPSIM